MKNKIKYEITGGYESFKLLVSHPDNFMGGKCPLCGTKLLANVQHECKDGVPVETKCKK